MQNSAWIALLNRIPTAKHHNLMLLTSIGTEIAFQDILRLEEECLVFRGRVAGTTDTGRVFFVPYSEINYLGFQKAVKEEEIYAMYGETPPPRAAKTPTAEEPAPPTAEAPPPVEEPEPAKAEAEPKAETPPEPVQPAATEPRPSSKSALLDRLRARLAGNSEKPGES